MRVKGIILYVFITFFMMESVSACESVCAIDPDFLRQTLQSNSVVMEDFKHCAQPLEKNTDYQLNFSTGILCAASSILMEEDVAVVFFNEQNRVSARGEWPSGYMPHASEETKDVFVIQKIYWRPMD